MINSRAQVARQWLRFLSTVFLSMSHEATIETLYPYIRTYIVPRGGGGAEAFPLGLGGEPRDAQGATLEGLLVHQLQAQAHVLVGCHTCQGHASGFMADGVHENGGM